MSSGGGGGGSHKRRHAGAHHEEVENGERWLLTYADMITLLLALFVVLFAMSSINVKKFLEFKLGLTATFNPSAVNLGGGNGVLSAPSIASASGTSANVSSGGQTPTPHTNTAQLQKLSKELTYALDSGNLGKYATVYLGPNSITVHLLASKVFFQSDSASLGTIGSEVIDTVAGLVRFQPNSIEVQGYTDSAPITGGPFSSNWELSAARAASVVNRLNVADHISGLRLSATGYSDTRELAPNTSAANMAKNRRIDVVILGVNQTSTGTGVAGISGVSTSAS